MGIVCRINAHPVPEGFSECGGLVGQITGNKTLGTDEVIAEAIRDSYVNGQPGYIKSNITNVMRSMIDHISLDGNGRKIDGYFSFIPYLKGRIEDIARGIDPESNYVKVIARALKEMKIDTSDWTFVIEGAEGNLRVFNLSTGEELNVVRIGEPIVATGLNLRLGEGDTIDWSVAGTEKSGTFAADSIASDATTITVSDPLEEISGPEYNGMSLVLTFRIGGKKAVKSAVIRNV